MLALKNVIFTTYNFLKSYLRREKKKEGENELLCALYTISYAASTYVAW
jgi:hypothetical protein